MTNPCPTCGGDGEIPLMEEGDGGRFYGTGESDECPHCHGTGESPANPTQPYKEGDRIEHQDGQDPVATHLHDPKLIRLANAAFAAGRESVEGWRPIHVHQVLPADTWVALIETDEGDAVIKTAILEPNSDYFRWSAWTDWMPLPAPPKQEGE